MTTICKECGKTEQNGQGLDHRYWCPKFTPAVDPRDAEIARLRAALAAGIEDGRALGRAEERADMVAWLYDDRKWLHMRWSTLRAHHRDAMRDDIERGDHVGAAGKVKP